MKIYRLIAIQTNKKAIHMRQILFKTLKTPLHIHTIYWGFPKLFYLCPTFIIVKSIILIPELLYKKSNNLINRNKTRPLTLFDTPTIFNIRFLQDSFSIKSWYYSQIYSHFSYLLGFYSSFSIWCLFLYGFSQHLTYPQSGNLVSILL